MIISFKWSKGIYGDWYSSVSNESCSDTHCWCGEEIEGRISWPLQIRKSATARYHGWVQKHEITVLPCRSWRCEFRLVNGELRSRDVSFPGTSGTCTSNFRMFLFVLCTMFWSVALFLSTFFEPNALVCRSRVAFVVVCWFLTAHQREKWSIIDAILSRPVFKSRLQYYKLRGRRERFYLIESLKRAESEQDMQYV